MVSGKTDPDAGNREIPGAEGSDYYAPSTQPKQPSTLELKTGQRIEDRRKSVEQYFGEDRRSSDRRQFVSSEPRREKDENEYQLRSKAESLYPEAFIPVSSEFYQELTQEQRDKLMKLQAIAQEKAGFEKTAPKFFIEDFNPDGGSPASARGEAADPVSDAAPRLVVGGALIGAGLLATGLIVAGLLAGGPMLAAGLVGLGAGIAMVVTGR